MNERITELLIESDLMESIGVYAYDEDGWEPIVKRFAELIVLECVDKIKNADMTDLEGPDSEDVLWLVEKQIKQHFGVK